MIQSYISDIVERRGELLRQIEGTERASGEIRRPSLPVVRGVTGGDEMEG